MKPPHWNDLKAIFTLFLRKFPVDAKKPFEYFKQIGCRPTIFHHSKQNDFSRLFLARSSFPFVDICAHTNVQWNGHSLSLIL